METPLQTEGGAHIEYAGFWIRVAASLIDTLLYGILLIPILALTLDDAQWSSYSSGGMHSSSMSFETMHIPGGLNFLVNYLLPAVVIIFFWVYKSATPGKMMFKLKIVDAATGQVPRTSQYIVRYVGYYISSIFLLLGFIWVGFDRRKQGWHDKLAGTVVIRNTEKQPVRFDG